MFGNAMLETIALPSSDFVIVFLKNFLLFMTVTWWAEQGSNLRPIACRAIALPAELSARNFEYTFKKRNGQEKWHSICCQHLCFQLFVQD